MRTLYFVFFAVSFFLAAIGGHAADTMTVTVQGPETPSDTRYDYDQAVVRLALEKTTDSHGPFELKVTPVGFNSKRALTATTNGTFENYLVKYSVHDDLIDKVGIIPFPVDLGIVGYRVGFASTQTKSKLANLTSIEQLKKIEIIQGIGWLDTTILRHHDFNVRTGDDYNGMFRMVALNRSELFLRGANEMLNEWKVHQGTPDLTFDETIAVYYPLPRFFVTTKENTALKERIHKGLIEAYNDGSLIQLWEEKYLDSVDFVNLGARRIFRVSNPFLKRIDPSWEKYVYTALQSEDTMPTNDKELSNDSLYID
ncbi:MAG: hypothetical protein ABJN98_13475 [Roseibium sp.]